MLLAHIKFFIKTKRSGTSLPASISAWFLKKKISIVIFYYLTQFLCLVVFTSWDIGQYVYCNQGRIPGRTSYANDEVVFLSYEMLNRPKIVQEMSLYNQAIYAYFPVDFDALSSPWFSRWSSCFEACRLRVIAEVLKFSGLNSLLWSIQFENICLSFSWKS